MAGLETWLRQQLDDHLVEPNSGLGVAITYMLKHWANLTLFLRVPALCVNMDETVSTQVISVEGETG